ncbi:MAG: K(+)-transporting ATPase subunit C [Oceanipulchritudo sp.]
MNIFFGTLRIVLVSSIICVVGYGGLILGIAQTLTPHTANGSLITSPEGQVIGSRQIAQAFSQDRYFWPRLSAVDYDGAGAGGSNLAPTNPALAERAAPVLTALGATLENPSPADLVTASGSGLDPHISIDAARYQVPRVASARNVDPAQVNMLVDRLSFMPGGFLTGSKIVNVLEINLALDGVGTDMEEASL